jgi:hypothetical protein
MPLYGLSGNATTDLGLGGALQQQVAGLTEEERKRRMAQMQQQKLAGMGGTPATQMLFGVGGMTGGLSGGRGY